METESILTDSKSCIAKKIEYLRLGEVFKLAIGISIRANGCLAIGSRILLETTNNRSTKANRVQEWVTIIFIGGPFHAFAILLMLKKATNGICHENIIIVMGYSMIF